MFQHRLVLTVSNDRRSVTRTDGTMPLKKENSSNETLSRGHSTHLVTLLLAPGQFRDVRDGTLWIVGDVRVHVSAAAASLEVGQRRYG